MDRKRMLAQLELHEGLRCTPYMDTEDNLTIGIGYNVTARGWEDLETVCDRSLLKHPIITREEAEIMCRHDIQRVLDAVKAHFPPYVSLDPVRQRVIIDLAFNMGFKALTFKNCAAAIEKKDWSTAARELYKSKWSTQVGDGEGGKFDRADRLAKMLLTGNDYTS